MTKQPEDWLDEVPGDDIEDEDDEIIWVSKSEIKRDAEELKKLGAELVDLGKNALDKIPLDADLRAAISMASSGDTSAGWNKSRSGASNASKSLSATPAHGSGEV